MMRILDIGPGRHLIRGADVLVPTATRGRRRVRGRRLVGRWGFEPIPAEDATYDLVHASHVLEHIPWPRTHRALCEAYRVLKPGGRIEVWVPDFTFIVWCYLRREYGDGMRRYNRTRNEPMLWVQGYLYGRADDELERHGACFDARYLESCLLRVGFMEPVQLAAERARVAHGPINLGMEAKKP